jgi:peptidylprolyl isomerase
MVAAARASGVRGRATLRCMSASIIATAPKATTPAPAPAAPAAPDAPAPDAPPVDPTAPKQWDTEPAIALKPATSYTASIATTDGVLGVQLLPGAAPHAVNNFVFLAGQGFYKDVPIHRMIPGFMAQSGDPTGTGTGGPGYTIKDDPVPDGLDYRTGVLAMANTGEPDSAGSQFFVMLGDTPLPKTYSIFGYVTSGQDVLAKINARSVTDNGEGEQSKPVDPIFVKDVTVTETPVADAKDAAAAVAAATAS